MIQKVLRADRLLIEKGFRYSICHGFVTGTTRMQMIAAVIAGFECCRMIRILYCEVEVDTSLKTVLSGGSIHSPDFLTLHGKVHRCASLRLEAVSRYKQIIPGHVPDQRTI